jgi:pimeloyl-ACP methyl ester carboxylesterase
MTHVVSLPGGATMSCADEGAGDALLLVHGWTCDANDYAAQIEYFRPHWRTLAPDLRGHGRSAVTRDGYDSRTFARDLIELLDALGIDRCVVVGHSLGGVIASVMAVEWPERVRAIVCLDPAYGVVGEELDACLALADRLEDDDWASYLAGEFAGWEHASTPAHVCELHVARMLATDALVVRETFRQLFAGPDPLAVRARAESYLRGRRCPVFVLRALDAAERVEWESGLPHHPLSRFLHLPLGHWLHQDAPDTVNRVIDEWLRLLPEVSTTEVSTTSQPFGILPANDRTTVLIRRT